MRYLPREPRANFSSFLHIYFVEQKNFFSIDTLRATERYDPAKATMLQLVSDLSEKPLSSCSILFGFGSFGLEAVDDPKNSSALLGLSNYNL